MPADRRSAWDRALTGAATGKLTDAARAFEPLTRDDPGNGAAWYNLGLVRAWLGDNRAALEALDRYIEQEPDENRAGTAAALGEVLRFGHGMEDQADYVEYSALFQMRDPQRVIAFLQQWEREGRLIGVQVRQEENMLTGILVEPLTSLAVASGAATLAKLAAYLLVIGDLARFWHTDPEALTRVREEVGQRAAGMLAELDQKRGPANFGDVMAQALAFPTGRVEPAEFEGRVREHVQRYFEETWIHRPLRSLAQVPPVDAAGHGNLRKRLRGVIQFLQDCAAGEVQAYDFDRLRRKLAGTEAPEAAAPEFSALSTAELAALPVESLADEQVEEAYQAAQKLDAHELALGSPRR
jgi:tetratricopeptide (TPR) repeat protein